VIENFIGTKSQRNFLDGLKRKIDIFMTTKSIFNLIYTFLLLKLILSLNLGLNMFLVPIFCPSLTNSPYISINIFKIPTFFLR